MLLLFTLLAEVMKVREEKNSKSSRKVINFTKKRWVYPALYVGVAAVLVSGVFVYQGFFHKSTISHPGSSNQVTTTPHQSEPSVSTSKSAEVMKKPVGDDVQVQKPFYSDSLSQGDQQSAIVQNGTTYTTNAGIDYVAKDGKAFDVTAALSGTVVKVEKDALLGYVVQVQNSDKIMTYYQSLDSVQVEEGMTVIQGQLIGKAGHSQLNQASGVHMHFEVRKDGVAVDPTAFIGKTLDEASKSVEQTTPSATDSTAVPSTDNNSGTNSSDTQNSSVQSQTTPSDDSSTIQPANPGSDNGADVNNSGSSSDNSSNNTTTPDNSNGSNTNSDNTNQSSTDAQQ